MILYSINTTHLGALPQTPPKNFLQKVFWTFKNLDTKAFHAFVNKSF